jgi:DNA repair protein RecO (recombination protein O)
MAVKRSKAIVIGHYPLGETDRIVIFLTRDYGKIRAVAKGARKIKSRLCGRLEILIYGDLLYYERTGKDLHNVNSFDTVEPFQILREDFLKMAYCSYIAELIQRAVSEEETDPETFDLMLNVMTAMVESNDPEIIVRAFEIRLLERMGLSPKLSSCIVCSGEISDPNPKFSIQSGGVLCKKCSDSGYHGIIISRDSLEMMIKMQETDIDLIPRLKASNSSKQEIGKLLSSFIAFHMDVKNLHSVSFLESIKSEYKGQDSDQ